jgi:hypothetical protein
MKKKRSAFKRNNYLVKDEEGNERETMWKDPGKYSMAGSTFQTNQPITSTKT